MYRKNTVYFVYFILLHKLPYTHQEINLDWIFKPLKSTDKAPINLYFNRLVAITMDIDNFVGEFKQRNFVPGVIINEDQVLTSYSAIKYLAHQRKTEIVSSMIYICIYTRKISNSGEKILYGYNCYNIKCGRRLNSIQDKEAPNYEWRGLFLKYGPLYDLMVFRINKELKIRIPIYSFSYGVNHINNVIEPSLYEIGPVTTNMATADQQIDKSMKLVTLTNESRGHAYRELEVSKYENGQNVLLDCDNWLPRYLGYFICLRNGPEYDGFDSGSMLFSNAVLFGVGGFTLWKGRSSVLVFTDVRPYRDMIMDTCSDSHLIS